MRQAGIGLKAEETMCHRAIISSLLACAVLGNGVLLLLAAGELAAPAGGSAPLVASLPAAGTRTLVPLAGSPPAAPLLAAPLSPSQPPPPLPWIATFTLQCAGSTMPAAPMPLALAALAAARLMLGMASRHLVTEALVVVYGPLRLPPRSPPQAVAWARMAGRLPSPLDVPG